jgi:hypothetical protein
LRWTEYKPQNLLEVIRNIVGIVVVAVKVVVSKVDMAKTVVFKVVVGYCRNRCKGVTYVNVAVVIVGVFMMTGIVTPNRVVDR